MEYGLWNFHGGFWTGGNGGFPSNDGLSRNFYTSVNNEIEPSTFHVTSPVNVTSANPFTNTTGTQPCQIIGRTNLEFLSVKNTIPANGRVPPMVMSGHQDELLQSVALEDVPVAPDLITEQNSMDSLTPTDSTMSPLLNHQQNPSNNSSNNNNNNNNNHITNNNNNNNKDDVDDNSLSELGKKDRNKIEGREVEEVWEDSNAQGTNIKLENNPSIDYLFQQSYQHPMYGMSFTRVPNNKREAGTSDETDEEDGEMEDGVPQVSIDSMQSSGPPIQNESSDFQSVPNIPPTNYSKSGYECGECGMVAETRPGLKKHITLFHPTPNSDLRLNNTLLRKVAASSKCPMSSCRFRSSERSEMEAHMTRHVAGGFKLNGKKKSGQLTPQRVRYEREEYRCQICAYSCTVEKAFYKHLKIHSVGRQMNQIKISCVICGKDRSSEVDMNKHMKKHRDDRYFCCDICIFKTVQLKKLIQHRRMHTGEKPHLCPHCSYRSARRDNLRSHVRRVHKKDNLFCDTFSPRGLVITENSTNSPVAVPATSISSGTSTQQPPLVE
ncbi:hypothetical protein RUM43_003027 [Polyplax serrata]|uniref:C2H2-type domain-containing protein n=1 Tax=Polyplax serrata TaxID=468196 RepID=A0AAN8S2Y4_POLSC